MNSIDRSFALTERKIKPSSTPDFLRLVGCPGGIPESVFRRGTGLLRTSRFLHFSGGFPSFHSQPGGARTVSWLRHRGARFRVHGRAHRPHWRAASSARRRSAGCLVVSPDGRDDAPVGVLLPVHCGSGGICPGRPHLQPGSGFKLVPGETRTRHGLRVFGTGIGRRGGAGFGGAPDRRGGVAARFRHHRRA